jgi:Mg/Co/Ni transporter MgtE
MLTNPCAKNWSTILDTEEIAQVVADLASDDALDIIGDLDAAEQRDALASIPADQRLLYEEALPISRIVRDA